MPSLALATGAGAAEGLETILARLLKEQEMKQREAALAEQVRSNQAGEALRGREIDAVSGARDEATAQRKSASDALAQDRRDRLVQSRADRRPIGAQVPIGEFAQEQTSGGISLGNYTFNPVGSPIDLNTPGTGILPMTKWKGTQGQIQAAENNEQRDVVTPGSFEDYLTKTYGPNPTSEQIVKARETYGRADNAPASFIVQTVDAQGNPITKVAPRTIGTELDAAPTAEMRNRQASIGRVEPVLGAIEELSARINQQTEVMATIQGFAERAKAQVNLSDDVAEYQRIVSGFVPLLARAVGHVGVLTQQDVDSVKEMLPKPTDSKPIRDRLMNRVRSLIAATSGAPTPSATPDGQPLTGQATPAAPGRRRYDINGNPLP